MTLSIVPEPETSIQIFRIGFQSDLFISSSSPTLFLPTRAQDAHLRFGQRCYARRRMKWHLCFTPAKERVLYDVGDAEILRSLPFPLNHLSLHVDPNLVLRLKVAVCCHDLDHDRVHDAKREVFKDDVFRNVAVVSGGEESVWVSVGGCGAPGETRSDSTRPDSRPGPTRPDPTLDPTRPLHTTPTQPPKEPNLNSQPHPDSLLGHAKADHCLAVLSNKTPPALIAPSNRERAAEKLGEVKRGR